MLHPTGKNDIITRYQCNYLGKNPMAKVIFEQVFYRIGTSVRGKPKQKITVQIEIEDDEHPQIRRQKAQRALYDLPNTSYLSGWTSWQSSKSTVIPMEDAVIIEDEETPVKQEQEAAEVFDAKETTSVEEPTEAVIIENPAVEEKYHTGEVLDSAPTPESAKDALKRFARYKIKNVYDDPNFPHWAIDILQPDFEYPDWENERVNKLWKR